MLSVVRNPSLFEAYRAQWKTNAQVRAEGFRTLMQAKFVCHCCGVQSPPSQAAMDGYLTPVDLGHAAFAVRDAKKAIALCPMCLDAHSVNVGIARGVLVYRTGLTQAQLIRLMACVGAIKASSECSDALKTMADTLIKGFQYFASQEAKGYSPAYARASDASVEATHTEHFDGQTADEQFVTSLSLLPVDTYKARHAALDGLLFMPDIERYQPWCEHLAETGGASYSAQTIIQATGCQTM